jgi:cytochrome c oxidase cbb3-type subunit 2
MDSEKRLLTAGMLMLGLSTCALVVLPYILTEPTQPSADLRPYSEAEWRGRKVYISNGCIACHSQQPRSKNFAPADFQRGWGRASVAGDYAFDTPHLLGTMRTGPDLLNIGARQPSEQWHLGHLYQPRAYVPGSIMPAYPYLFEIKPEVSPTDVRLSLPPAWQPSNGYLVARQDALDLVAYLKALDRTYPAMPTQRQVKNR